MTQDELADMVEDVPDGIVLDEGLGPDVTALTEDTNQPVDDEPVDDEPDTTTTPEVTMDVDSALDGIANEGPDSSTTMTTIAEEDENAKETCCLWTILRNQVRLKVNKAGPVKHGENSS